MTGQPKSTASSDGAADPAADSSGAAAPESSSHHDDTTPTGWKITSVRVHYGDDVPDSDPPVDPDLECADYVPEACALWAGSPPANTIGFLANSFDGYVYRYGDEIFVAVLVIRKTRGAPLIELADAVERAGYQLRIPTTLGHLERAVCHAGFTRAFMKDPRGGHEIEVWSRAPRAPRWLSR